MPDLAIGAKHVAIHLPVLLRHLPLGAKLAAVVDAVVDHGLPVAPHFLSIRRAIRARMLNASLLASGLTIFADAVDVRPFTLSNPRLRAVDARRAFDARRTLANVLTFGASCALLRALHALRRGASLLTSGLTRSASIGRLGTLPAVVALGGLAVLVAAMIARPGSGRR